MITENLNTLKIHKLTKAQYERELAAGNIDENALYLTPAADADNEVIAVDINGDGNVELKSYVVSSISSAEGVAF